MGVLLLVSVLALASPAAPPPVLPANGVELEWDAPPECPSADRVRGELAGMLPVEARGSARARVERDGDALRLELTVTTPRGTTSRQLQGEACDALGTATAVIVAVAVDPVEVGTHDLVAPPPVLVDARPSVPPPVSPRGRAPRRADDRAPSMSPVAPSQPARSETSASRGRQLQALALGASGGVGVGALPGPHLVGSAWLGPQWRRLEIVLGAAHHLARPADRPQGGGADISLTVGRLSAGPMLRRGRGSIHLLGGLEGGAMVAVGRDLDRTYTAISPWLALIAQPAVTWAPARWIALRGSAMVGAALTRPRFRTDDGSIVHRSEPLTAQISLGLEFRVPHDQSRPGRRPR